MTARLLAAVVKDAFLTADDYLPRWPYAVFGFALAALVAPHAWLKHVDAKVCDALDVWGDE